jgi:hypothetical protein
VIVLPTALRTVRRRRCRRLLAIGAASALGLGLAACGNELSHPKIADTEGVYVDAGPITYQVQISRQLNPYSVEDKEYLAGSSTTPPTRAEEWFGVFLWAKNQTHSNATTSTLFDIVDTQGNKYYPIPINPQVNPFAWTAQTLAPHGTEPAPDSPAYFSATQGGELLFKIGNSAYSNRPLRLQIYAAGQPRPSTVLLDL